MGKEVGILIKMILICKISVSGTKLKPDDPAIPCGLIAKSIFNGRNYEIILLPLNRHF